MSDDLLAQARRAVEMMDESWLSQGSSPIGKDLGPVPEMRRETITRGLIESGARRAIAERHRANAVLDLADWVRAARAEGMSLRHIARLAQVSPTLVAMFERRDR